MDQNDPEFKRGQLEKAIAAQEGLRGTLDDEILDITIAVLRKQLDELNPEPVVEQLRKQVSILFMDVVGSTSIFSEFDPEEHMAIMDTALQKLAAPVNAHGGKVTHFMGDGFLAVFGLPVAQENDPELAVRSGLGILETAKVIAQDLEKEYHLKGFQVRVGVNTGLVVAGGVTEAEDTIIGSAVNLAARLESAAPPGGLLISQYTYQHVRGIFDFNPSQFVEAKGFPEPVQAYQVQRAKPHAFRIKTRGVEGIETSMVGRDLELKSLQESADVVFHNHRGQFITVVGDAGVGKSRLLEEFENWLNQMPVPFLLLQGRATIDTLNLPYALMRNLFVSHFEIRDDDPVPVVIEKITDRFKQTLGEETEYERNAHFVGQLLGYGFYDSPYLKGVMENPQQLRDRALIYLADFIKAHQEKTPVVIFLDDIHWADDSSLDVIDRLSKDIFDHQILFVALTRPSFFERRTSWGKETHYQQLVLQPLSHLESERLLGQVLQKVQEIPAQLSEMIVNYAEGNPFYLEELVKMLVEDGVIIKGEPSWQVQSGRLLEVQIPATLVGVIQARLDRLPVRERTLLQQASVVGRVFWDGVVAYINHDVQSWSVPAGSSSLGIVEYLDILQEREMIIQRNASTFSETIEYMFAHAVLQEVTYESVLKRARRVYHAKVADWLILHSGDRVGEVAGLIGNHLVKAGNNTEALEYLCMAAEKAASNYAIEEALDFYTRALAIVFDDDLERRYMLLMGQEKVLGLLGNREGQRDILNNLTTVVDALGDQRKTTELLIRQAWFSFWTSEISAGLAAAKKAVELSELIGDQSLSRQAYYAWAWMLFQHGDSDLALEQAKVALAMARQAGDRRAEGNTLNILGQIFISQGDFYAALGYLKEFLRIGREIGDLEREVTALNNLGAVLTRLGDYSSGRDHFQQILTITQEIGYWSSESTAFINLGWVTSAQGDWELARKYSEAGIARKREQKHSEAMAEGLLWLGHAWLGLNQPDKAESAYRESLIIRQQLDQPNLAMWVKACLAQVSLVKGNLSDALEHVNEITSYLDHGGNLQETWEPMRIYLICYQVLQAAQNPLADQILETAFGTLQEQAAKILDPTYRDCFLEKISWHREIIVAWEARQAEKT